jgi:monothiol glutaredoxin
MSLSEPMRDKIAAMIRESDVVLFMKGTRRAPQCGFSATVVRILDDLVPQYHTVDVLSDPALRDGIKEFSSWPTIPQLYVKGEFVGGCDIVKEMHASGELLKTLGVTRTPPEPPSLRVSQAAVDALNAARESDADLVHVEIGPSFEYGLFFGPRQAGDVEAVAGGLVFLFDASSARRADGLSIDFIEGPSGSGFKLESPNEPPKVKQLSPAELKAMMDRGEPIELFDVRTEKERAIAVIDGARHLDAEGQRYLEGLDKRARLVFHCHHGGRSQAAAEHCLASGFKDVSNLKGGIDAWSLTVDPTKARY